MIPMIVKKPFRATGSGSPLQAVGAKYNAVDKRQAALFRALGWAEDAPVVVPVVAAILKPRTYQSRALVSIAEPVTERAASLPAAELPATEEVKPKRAYHRRDLKAED